MNGEPAELPPAALCRRLVRAAERATLATLAAKGTGDPGGPWPYASLVLVACAHDARPLLLVSDLADHTKNLRADPRVSLLYDGTAGLDEPLTGPRVSLQGEAEIIDDDALMRRYVRRHPSAAQYAGFGDFHLVRIRPVRAHLVAGFGRIHWIEAGDLVFDTGPAAQLIDAEADIVKQMNADEADLLDRIASRQLGRRNAGWRLTGIDPEGIDLRRGSTLLRLEFPEPVATPREAVANMHGMAAGR